MENKVSETAYVNGTGRVHLERKNVLSSLPIHWEFNKFYYREIFKLLINIYEETISIPGLKVYSIYSIWSDGLHNVPVSKENDLFDPACDDAFTEFEYNKIYYAAYFKIVRDKYDRMRYCINFSYDKKSEPNYNIGTEFLKLAFTHTSSYKKGCLEISHTMDLEDLSNIDVRKVVPPKSNFDGIFIDDNIKNDINRFIHTFKNFTELKIPLRYLLSGNPGLGKTEVIRTVIEQCAGHGVVIIPKNMRGVEGLIFEFARLFEPAVICIDDIDLLFRRREDGQSRQILATFLTELDGIFQNKFFLIATTNDKRLVDIAASRPGRFDEIIDFGDFQRKYYPDLIKQRTTDEEIINLFNEEVFDFMESKKVTGAYIVNLIKQLKIIKGMDPMFSKDNLMEYLERNYKGFYKSQLKEEKTLGFGK